VPVLARRLAAEAVDRTVAGSGDDPPGWARWHSAGWLPLHGRHERVLHGLFGDVDVTEDPHQDGHRATVLLAEDIFNL